MECRMHSHELALHQEPMPLRCALPRERFSPALQTGDRGSTSLHAQLQRFSLPYFYTGHLS